MMLIQQFTLKQTVTWAEGKNTAAGSTLFLQNISVIDSSTGIRTGSQHTNSKLKKAEYQEFSEGLNFQHLLTQSTQSSSLSTLYMQPELMFHYPWGWGSSSHACNDYRRRGRERREEYTQVHVRTQHLAGTYKHILSLVPVYLQNNRAIQFLKSSITQFTSAPFQRKWVATHQISGSARF